MTKIAVLVGSLRADSLNKKLALNLEKLAPKGTEFEYIDLRLPLYDTDLEVDFPKEAAQAKSVIADADGVLIVTPEYNRGIPGVLKNAIDWVSRPYGQNSLSGKPLAVAGASVGPIGTAVAQANLRQIAGHLNARLAGQPELYLGLAGGMFDENNELVADAKGSAEAFIENFVAFVKAA